MTENSTINQSLLTKLVEKYYTKKSLTKTVTSYILYYQIALGDYTFRTTHDPDETIKKLKQLNLALNPNQILLNIMAIIVENLNDNQLEENFDNYVKNRALLNALEDFTNNDQELLNKERFINSILVDIQNNSYFNSQMKIQYLKEYQSMFEKYDTMLDEDYIEKSKNIILTNVVNQL
jgi:hypothetical protein